MRAAFQSIGPSVLVSIGLISLATVGCKGDGHTDPTGNVDEVEQTKIEAELNYEHYKAPSRSC